MAKGFRGSIPEAKAAALIPYFRRARAAGLDPTQVSTDDLLWALLVVKLEEY